MAHCSYQNCERRAHKNSGVSEQKAGVATEPDSAGFLDMRSIMSNPEPKALYPVTSPDLAVTIFSPLRTSCLGNHEVTLYLELHRHPLPKYPSPPERLCAVKIAKCQGVTRGGAQF